MSIKFIVKVNKLGIYYFYLNNLALEGKKIWVRKNYNKKFISIAGPLDPHEKESINLLRRIILLLEQKEKPLNLLEIFFDENPWEKLVTSVNKLTYKNIIRIFNTLNGKWQIFWQKELASEAILGENFLEKNIKKEKKYINKILKDLSILYNGKLKLPSTIKIFLVPLPADIKERGGKYIPPLNAIVLESSGKRVREKRAIEIVLHETVHLCFENKKFFENIDKVINKIPFRQQNKLLKPLGISSIRFGLKEIIATATTATEPKGHGRLNNYSKLLKDASNKLKPLIKKYINNRKYIDNYFIKNTVAIWIDFIKKERL